MVDAKPFISHVLLYYFITIPSRNFHWLRHTLEKTYSCEMVGNYNKIRLTEYFI